MASSPAVFKILPTIQQYDWGKTGRSSKVAQFASESQIPDFKIDERSPYAELWMGTHPKSPSLVKSTNEVLSEHLAKHPELIGAPVIEKFDAANGNLPFLFKVLSIEKALSIQTHPDKKTAEVLHAQSPDIYKDPNHKPEMALAITPFEALCGFRPLPEIALYLNNTPELKALLPPPVVDAFLSISDSPNPTGPQEKAALKTLFAELMTADVDKIKERLDVLLARYNSGEANEGEDMDIVKLVLKLSKQFPGDVGIFCVYFLNYVHLTPGDAIFLGAGEPHAYISGECIECMANSDNVIRAGLTPKLRDVPNLISGLTYEASSPLKHHVEPSTFRTSSDHSKLYDPPIPEFSVVRVRVSSMEEVHPPVAGPSIMIVTAGQGLVKWGDDESLVVKSGDVLFAGASTAVKYMRAGEADMLVYRAFVEA